MASVASGGGNSPTLRDAAGTGDIEEVKRLVEGGADIEATDVYGMAPLHWATIKGHEEVARLLVASEANIETIDDAFQLATTAKIVRLC
jgi:ankyrin repeat protein